MKFKRFLALALSLLMVFGGAASIFAADDDATTEAEEVTAANPYQAAIDALKVLGIFKGDDNGDSADKAVNRWQMALFVSRALTGEIDDAYWGKTAYDYSKFTDVTGTSSLYLGAIGFANQKGIILGYDDPKTGKPIFNPDGGITYQDALTMATRTLGFTGLAYPWGVIEKAIDLELTKGLVDVGYQDELTRGEVAQIVYNMLIAKVLGADGKYWTLKDKAFGIQEAVVVIVAGDQVRYDIDKEVLKRDNYVSFQILGDDGKVTKPVYSISAAAFGIDSDEDPDAYVGYSYSVATSDDFASFISCEINETATYWNLGKTTKNTEFTISKFNEGKANEYTKLVIVNPDDAKDTTDNYSIVENYTTLRTIQGAKTGVEKIPGDLELLVYNPSLPTTIVTEEGVLYKDAYGHIVKVSQVFNTTTGKIENTLTVVYYYNAFTQSYYKVLDNSAENAVYVDGVIYYLGYVPVTSDEIDAAKIGRKTIDENSFKQITEKSNISSTYAYASLTLIDDYRAYEGYDRGIYKPYGVGQIITTEKDGDGNLLTRIYVPNGNVSTSTAANDNPAKNRIFSEKTSETKLTFVDAVTGKKLDTPKSGAWVLFYYNAQTKTVEVLETLTVEHGVLTGWNIGDKTVTIGNEKFPANYDTLLNNGIKYGKYNNDKNDYSVDNNKALYSLYTRGINYIVLDGDVVWIEPDAAESKGVVVLHSFLGMTADGMLEFYAYTTKDPGALRKIVVGSVNNYYYGYYSSANNLYNYYANVFTNVKGEEYKIAAVSDAGVYYLQSPDSNYNTFTLDTYYRGVFASKLPKINGGDEVVSVSIASDTYFVFVRNGEILTATGNPALSVITGNDIPGTYYWATSKMIVVEIDDTDDGATLWAQLKTAFDTTSTIKYYYAKSGINYPAGTTNNTALGTAGITFSGLVNIVTGKNADDITTTNVNIRPNKVYEVVDGVVTTELTGTYTSIWNDVLLAYTYTVAHNSNYVYGGTLTFDYTNSGKSLSDRYDDMRKAIIADRNNANGMTSNISNLIYGKNNVVIRTLSLKDKIDISDKYSDPDNKGNMDIIATKATSQRYTIQYFYNSKTGEIAAYVRTDLTIDTPAIVPSTIVTVGGSYGTTTGTNNAQTTVTGTTAQITGTKNSVAIALLNSVKFNTFANVATLPIAQGDKQNVVTTVTFNLAKKVLTTSGYTWTPVDADSSTITFNADGSVATITFKYLGNTIELDKDTTYSISNIEIYTEYQVYNQGWRDRTDTYTIAGPVEFTVS